MYKESDIAFLFGKDEAKRVCARNRGGRAGQKGTRFEDFFAVYKLAEHLGQSYRSASGKFHDRKGTVVHSQILAIVDDVAVEFRKRRLVEHYQLKNAQSVSWDSGASAIQHDFQKQRDCLIRG